MGCADPLRRRSAHPISVLSGSVASYLCYLMLTCTHSNDSTHSFRYASYLLMVSPKTAQAMSRNLVNHNAGTSNSGSNAFAQNFAFDPLLSDSRITGGESNYRSITPEDQATSNALPEGGVANTMATVDVDGERAKFPEPKGINEAAERARFPTPNMDGHDFVTRTDTYFAELSRFPIPDMAAGAAATGRATPEDAAATDGIVANAASAGVAMAGVDRAAERSKYPTPAGLSDSYTGRATPVDRPTDNNLEGRVAVAAMMKPVADRASERAKFPAPTWANNNASYRNTTAYRSSTPEDQATSNALPEGGVANNMATVDVHAERTKFPAPTTSARNEW